MLRMRLVVGQPFHIALGYALAMRGSLNGAHLVGIMWQRGNPNLPQHPVGGVNEVLNTISLMAIGWLHYGTAMHSSQPHTTSNGAPHAGTRAVGGRQL